MKLQRVKIFGVFILIIVLTITLGACDLFEDDPVMYELTINIEGEGTTEPAAGTYEYEEGTTTDIEAIPAEEHKFVKWEGNVQKPDEPKTSVLMESDETVTVIFEEVEPEDAYFEIVIDKVESDNEVRLEEELTIITELENTGDVSETQEVEMVFQEEVVNTKDITLDAEEDITKEFTHKVSDKAELGYTDVVIESKDDSDGHEVYITEFAGGRGTEDNPFLVETADQLNRVRNNLDKNFKQSNDIDLSYYSEGNGWNPIGDENNPFTGIFNGNGYNITNLTIERIENPYSFRIGLFGYIGSNAVLKGINLKKTYVTGRTYVGSLVGKNEGTILNSYAKGNVKGNRRVGGLIGENINKIIDSHTKGTVEGNEYIGGLIGSNTENANIKNSCSTANVMGSETLGGFVGYNGGEIIQSYALGDLKENFNAQNIGGFAGSNGSQGTIKDSFAKGSVKGELNTGGFVGMHWSGNIINSYATGNVEGQTNVGGFAGSIYGGWEGPGEIENSYYDKEKTGHDDEDKGEPKLTEKMKQQSTFEPEWDFNDIWTIEEDESYPYFQWQDENIPVP